MAYESQPKQIYVRLDDALLARIDRFIEHLTAQQPGLKPNRSDAIRVLVHKGLDAFDTEEGTQ
jgi:metal-responsive CopG/Arc/MetJ family transcriptional regulator